MRTLAADSVKVDFTACFFGAILLLTLPLKWLLAAVLAAVVHELCHILALRLLGGRIWEIRIGIGGAVMETEPLPYGKELICALAGPAGSLLLLLFCRWIPRTAFCALGQALYNLLPIFPLDGGRILCCGVSLLAPKKWAGRICRGMEIGTVLTISVLAFAAAIVWHWGILPLLLASVLAIKVGLRKIPCKAAQLGVQ